jgi:cytochrome c biogenesis protein CcmG/thiol:disulfide interchange protein DsbE
VKRNSVVLLVVIAAVIAIIVLGGRHRRKLSAAGGALKGDGVGALAPDFTLTTLGGKQVKLSDYRGKAVLLNFWATWCAPCKIETPWLVELRNKYAGQGFEILGIDAEGDDLKPDDKAGWAKNKSAIAKFVQQEKMPYPVLINGDSLSTPYGGLDELPTSFFVNRKGTVVAAQLGLTSEQDIESNIKKALTQ